MTYEGKTLIEINQKYSKSNHNTIASYFDYLIKNELIFFTDTPNLFPKLNFSTWDHPSEIYQAIIDIGSNLSILNKELLLQLNKLNCKYIDLRVLNNININLVFTRLQYLNGSSILGVNIYLKYSKKDDIDQIINLSNKNLRINNIFIYGSPENRQHAVLGKNASANIFFIKQADIGPSCRGLITPSYFSPNITAFTESKKHNSCLNRKISIDQNGFIKNCPSMAKSYGNLKNTKLSDVIKKPAFKKYWNITKDDIKSCKICEFRYICPDCRAFIEDPEDIYSKPLKCGYDPQTSKWADWSKNPLKSKVIDHYMQIDALQKNS